MHVQGVSLAVLHVSDCRVIHSHCFEGSTCSELAWTQMMSCSAGQYVHTLAPQRQNVKYVLQAIASNDDCICLPVLQCTWKRQVEYIKHVPTTSAATKALAIKQSSNQGQDFKMKAGLANNPSYPDMVSEAMQVDLHGDK